MGEEAYREMISRHVDIIKPGDRSDEALCKARLDICRGCPKLNAGTCAACGCFVEIRAALKRSTCPDRKWNEL